MHGCIRRCDTANSSAHAGSAAAARLPPPPAFSLVRLPSLINQPLQDAGNAAFVSGEFSNAVKHFTAAIAVAPTNHVLYSNRSAAYASLAQFPQALADAQSTVELKGDWPKGYSRLGAAHYGLREYDEAVEAYTKGG